MDPVVLKIVPMSDNEYVEAFEKIGAEGVFEVREVTLGWIPPRHPSGLRSDPNLQGVLNAGARVFQYFSFAFMENLSVSIRRSGSAGADSVFDVVSLIRPDNFDSVKFAEFVASVQKHLGQSSLLHIGNLLGPDVAKHFEARDVALARLERLSATLLKEMETSRKQREKEFSEKEKAVEAKLEQKERQLEEATQVRRAALDKRAAELENLQKELDDRAAKHARRQHYKEIKEKFRSWSETFQVTKGTTRLRSTVFWFTLLLLSVFGALAGWFLFQSFTLQDSTQIVAAIVKQVAFTALFVSTSYFFIRWNNQWAQRHIDEEFRLKRMELDIDRASWFVEMAFEWKEEKDEEIPIELVERLTHGLFRDEKGDHLVEPSDSLAHALIGAARFKVKLADGTEAEYDRKGIKELIRKNSRKPTE